jgi:predicted alpha/beta hydrolase
VPFQLRGQQPRARRPRFGGFDTMKRSLCRMLGQWHQWRGAYSHERGYARVRVPVTHEVDDDDLDAMIMRAMEDEISRMPQEAQLALQHIGRAECLGVEVLFNRMPRDRAARDALCADALARFERRMVALGLV